ncbi:unnamed protein product [Mytilus edulis]|uniref:2'-phosphotransferase n=1 Tax=Mytilus edulis TaxID=6550 RepID=A0A8S3R8I5_MYTED|nr:unnamed protein product [Mytilus edulis]
MDQPSGQRADAHQQGGFWRGDGNRNQRGRGRGRGRFDNDGGEYKQYNRDNNRQGKQSNNRGYYRQDNRQYNQEERHQSGFGRPTNSKRPNVQQQEDMTQGQNNFNDRARPIDKNNEDHMRDSSPDRQDRSRHKDKNDEDHTRDPSPDRSLPEHCIQENQGSSPDGTTQNQSPQVQNTGVSASQGMNTSGSQGINQQGFDNRNMEIDAQQGQGQVFYNKSHQEQDFRPQHNRGRGQQYNDYSDYSQGQDRDHQNQRYNRNQDGYHNQDRSQQHQRYDDRRDDYGRGQYQGHSDNNNSYQQGQRYNRGGYQQNNDRRQQGSWGEKSDIQLSKALSFILRHGAERQGYKMMPGEPGENGVISGMRQSCEVMIFINLETALKGQRLEFDENVKVVKVPIGGATGRKKIKFEDAVQNQDEEFVDAHGSGPDVILESSEEIITINDPDNSMSAVDYLMEKAVVAVHVELSEDGLRRITCVTEDKSYIFEVENNHYLMTSGKVAEFSIGPQNQRDQPK